MYQISKKQDSILKTFTCKRLSNCKDLNIALDLFESQKGASLVNYLKTYGLSEDKSGVSAFYLIQNEVGLPLLFFSLKCGSLFSPFNIEEHEERAEFAEKLLQVLNADRDETDDFQNILYEQLDELAVKSNLKVDKLISRLRNRLKKEHGKVQKKLDYYHKDEVADSENFIIRVGETLPGVELIHFCANDKAREFWKSLNIRHPMGEVLFWHFIISKIIEIQRTAGCKYLYLFAADNTEDRTLVNYYNVSLKFVKPKGVVGTNKPFYDFCCVFMAQEINRLVIERDEYFNHFNIDSDDVIA